MASSRKQNCSLFTAKGHFKNRFCPVGVVIMVKNEPKNKSSPCIFTVVVFGDADHDIEKKKTGRHLSGAAQVTRGKVSCYFRRYFIKT